MERQITKKEEARPVEVEGALPVRRAFAGLPSLAQRLEEMLGEPFGIPRWAMRWPELEWPRELARVPAVDVFEEGDSVVVKAEVPGLTREQIDVRISGDVLTLSGRTEKEEKVEKKQYHRYERASGAFARSLTLPVEVEIEKVTARLQDGILEIRAPKSAAARARSRTIQID